MNDNRVSLLRAIIAQPDEDTPRLAYADLLHEAGRDVDVARALLIRDQCNVERTAGVPAEYKDRQWHSRQQVFAGYYPARYRDVWLGELGVPVRDPVLVRGFVEGATMSPTDYRRYGSRLHAATPLRRVRFASPRPIDIGRLARLRHFSRLAEVEIESPYKLDGIEQLADSPNVRLQRLDLHTGLNAADVRRIARSEWAPELLALTVGGYRSSPHAEVAEVIDELSGDGFRGLRELEVTNMPVDRDAAAAIGSADVLGQLVNLQITSAQLDTAGILALISTPLFQRGLLELGLFGNSLTDADVAELAAAPGAERLVTLDLSGNQLTAAGARSLATSTRLDCLALLDVRLNHIHNDGLAQLLERFGRDRVFYSSPI